MSNLFKSKTFKVGGLVIAVAMMLSLAGVASAQTVVTTTTTVNASAFTYSGVMKYGMSGPGISTLQAALNSVNTGTTTIVVDGKFGPATLAAVKYFQSRHGLVADGVVGPLTGAALATATYTTIVVPAGFPAGCTSNAGFSTTTGMSCAVNITLPAGCTSTAGYSPTTGVKCSTTVSGLPAGCTSTVGYSPTTGARCDGGTSGGSVSGGLSGGAGSADYTIMSALTNEEVGEDEEDVEVAGIEIEANGSDLELTAVRLVFDEGTAASDFEDYAAEVSLWLDGEEVARVDSDEFNDDNDWTSTVSLDGAVVQEDETGELVVAVSGISNLDSNDATDTWTVDFRSVRYVDAQDASTSEDPSTAARTFSFESFATATDSELLIGEGPENDDVNDGHMINVHATSVTDEEAIFEFTLEAEGDSDLEIETFGVNIDVTGAGHVDDVVSGGTAPAIFLELDGEQFGTADYFDDADDTDVGTDEDVVFNDVDFTLEAGDEITGRIIVDLLALSGDLDSADTIAVTLGETESDQGTLIDVEDESGTALVDADITGSAASDAHVVYDVGFVFDLTDTSAEVTTPADGTNPDIGTFTHEFTVTAFDGDIALDKTCAENENQGDNGEGQSLFVTNAGSNAVVCSLATSDAISSTVSGNSWLIPSGGTRTFTVTTAVTAETSAFAKAYIEALNWDLDANAAATTLFLTAGLGEDNTSTAELYLSDND